MTRGQRPRSTGQTRQDLERQIRLAADTVALVSILASLMVPGLESAGLTVAALTNECAMGECS